MVSHCEAPHCLITQLPIYGLFFRVQFLEMMVLLALRQQSVLRGLAYRKPHESTHTMY